MKRSIACLLVAAALLAGCQSRPKATAAAPAAPTVIAELTDQNVVWECPKCGMDYDAPGKCSMCDADLEKTNVAYICPADNAPVDRAGKCPRCNMNARVVRTAAADVPASPGAAAPASGAANGS